MQHGAPSRCEIELGVILRRRCIGPARARCASCGKGACDLHLRPYTVPGQPSALWCVDCLRQLPPASPGHGHASTSSATDDADARATSAQDWMFVGSSSSGEPPGAAEPFVGEGGSFGGAGASGEWDEPQFSAEDYAAFDQTTAADRQRGGGSYDS